LEDINSKVRDYLDQMGKLQKQVEQLTEDKSRFEEKVKREN
jgi:phage shock protein A